MTAKEPDHGPCRWEITTRNPHQCRESGPCPHMHDPFYQCECIPRAREVEAGIIRKIESGEAAKLVRETIKGVRAVV